jgi:hypothetical protein
MAMTKQQLLTDLAATYKTVATPTLQETDGDLSWYLVNVLEVGTGANDKPLGLRKNVHFYVYKEGNVGSEEAYYMQEEPINGSNKPTTDTSATLLNIARLHGSATLTSRVKAAVLVGAYDVCNEAGSVTNHAERIKWAVASLRDPITATTTMMAYVALNASVQTVGLAATDNDLKYIVNSNIDTIATTTYGAA